MTPRWDRPPQQEIRTLCCLHAQCKAIKDGEKLPCSCTLWPMSCTTTISGAVGNTLNYRPTTAKMSSRLKVAGFFLFLCFVLLLFLFFSPWGELPLSQPGMGAECWAAGCRSRAEWDALLLVLSYFLRYVTPGGTLIGHVRPWSFTKAGKKAAHFVPWRGDKGKEQSFFLLSWAIRRNIQTETTLKNSRFLKQ